MRQKDGKKMNFAKNIEKLENCNIDLISEIARTNLNEKCIQWHYIVFIQKKILNFNQDLYDYV